MPFRPIRRLRLGFNRPKLRSSPLIQTANDLLASGHPKEAAPLFARLAREMEASGQAIRAANLHARAAHAYADSHAEAEALAEARLALAQFIALNITDRVPVFYRNITRKLINRGMSQAVQMLEYEFGSHIEMPTVTVGPPPGNQRVALPTECPHCGAPVLDTEVEWIDNQRARCEYCGGIFQTSEDL